MYNQRYLSTFCVQLKYLSTSDSKLTNHTPQHTRVKITNELVSNNYTHFPSLEKLDTGIVLCCNDIPKLITLSLNDRRFVRVRTLFSI